MHFLHIADVHFGCERGKKCTQADISARNNYMEKLTEVICNLNKEKSFDFILLTGDIAWSASTKEYLNASKWLNEIIEKCGLSNKKIFICPGNHDIDREEIEDIQYPSDQKSANSFLQIEKLQKLQRRFSEYINFCNNMNFEPYIIGDQENYLLGYRDMGDYRIVSINTAWYAKNDEVKDKMWVGAGFIEIIKDELKKAKKPTITIMHHPTSSWHQHERSNYLETSNVYDDICSFSDLILTGHSHEIITSLIAQNKTLIGGTGALFERNNYPNCFYTYDIDFSKTETQYRTQHFWHAKSWHQETDSFKLLYTYEKAIKDINVEKQENKVNITRMANDNYTESPQSNLYHIADQVVKYIPIVGSWTTNENEYYFGDFKVQINDIEYQLPLEIQKCFYESNLSSEEITNIEYNIFEDKVRFDGFKVQINGGDHPHSFKLELSKVTYRDFLIVKSVIDKILPSGRTVREKYLSEKNNLVSRSLPNVCGVGIFIITSDNKIIISESSPYVLVNPEQYIYSASGSMNWNGINTNPFFDIIRECEEEIGYSPSIENLRLYSIGMDYETGYYQFSFYERSTKTSSEIIRNAHMARDFNIEIQRIIAIDFTCENVMHMLDQNNNWDETARANLLTLAAKNFGIESVKKFIAPLIEKKDYRRNVTQMWNMRAERRGRLPVLSSRYPSQGLSQISDSYVNAVLDFIDEDLSNKSIVELGGGIGLFTKHFAEQGKAITCVDVCDKMIRKSKKYLGDVLSEKVDYVNCFFQDYKTKKHFDILVCSLVLIHNAPELDEIIKNMKRLSDVIYIFEHTDQGTQVGVHTEIKSADEYISMFPEYTVIKRSSHMLCQDNISFIKLQRNR